MPSRFLLISLFLGLGSCMTYDFEPVGTFALEQETVLVSVGNKLDKPDLFLVVDKSGSMEFGIDAPNCNCPNGSCPAGCPTRWTELKAAMLPFLSTNGSIAHFGMLPYPQAAANMCGSAVVSDIANYGVALNRSNDSDAMGMQATADAVRARILGITPLGGTPTGVAMGALLNYPPLAADKSRPHFALLLTDGLPNCNSANNPLTCTCSNGASPCGQAISCLDDDPTAVQIAKLKAAGITTIVLGFGAETGMGQGPVTLNKLAAAGGFQRKCMADSDCGAGDSCSPMVSDVVCGVPIRACARRYFQAGNTGELSAALDTIRNSIQPCEPCLFTLSSRPSDSAFLAVRLNDTSLVREPVNGYLYDEVLNQVEFRGASCDSLKNSTVSNPVKLEFRVVQTL